MTGAIAGPQRKNQVTADLSHKSAFSQHHDCHIHDSINAGSFRLTIYNLYVPIFIARHSLYYTLKASMHFVLGVLDCYIYTVSIYISILYIRSVSCAYENNIL